MRIYEADGRTIDVVDGATPPFLSVLLPTVWGTDGPRWVVEGLEEDLRRIPGLQSVLLRDRGELVGVYAVAPKDVRVGATIVPTIHRMCLSVRPDRAGHGYGDLLVSEVRRHFLPKSKMLYGYVEAENARPMKLTSSAGYQSLRTFGSTLFSRLRPHDDDRVGSAAREEVLPLLMHQYAHYSLVDIPASLHIGRYHALRENGRVVAGVQVQLRRWRMVAMPGRRGKVLRPLLPRLPLVRRLLPGGVFVHLLLSNVYVAEGHEASFFSLVEAVLARTGVHAALWFTDHGCRVLERVREAGDFGLIARFDPGSQAHVMAGLHDMPEALVDRLHDQPVLISPLDPT